MRRITRALALTSTLLGLTYVASAEDKPGERASSEGKHGERAMKQVFFNFNSATSTDDLLMVANQLQCSPQETIILDAYADPVGSDAYNAKLAQRRAENVRDQLVDLGIDANRIMVGVFGEKGQRRSSHVYDRRVEIRTSNEPVATLRERREGTAVAIMEPGEQQPEAVATP